MDGITTRRQPPKKKQGDGKGILRTVNGEAMDVRSGSALCGWSEKITRGMIDRRTIPHHKMNGRIIFLRSELLEWLSDLPGVTVEEARANLEQRSK
jgi:hypothetical protein